MPLPVSGLITIAQIAGEFGGVTPYSLSQYYKGGPYVKANDTAPNVPASGLISLSQFYGAAKAPAAGQVEYTTPGNYSWIVPAGVTSVCVVCIGSGAPSPNSSGMRGGFLAWGNNIPVVPGQAYDVRVPTTTLNGVSGTARFQDTWLFAGGGGDNSPTKGGTYYGGGGDPGYIVSGSASGTGAAGYTGNGGDNGGTGGNGGGGGAGGGGGGGNRMFNPGGPAGGGGGGGGGGTGIWGQGPNGGPAGSDWGDGGKGGSWGSNGGHGYHGDGRGGLYGGGGGANVAGGIGAVRIIWGPRTFFPCNQHGQRLAMSSKDERKEGHAFTK